MAEYLSGELKIGATSRRLYYRRSRSDEVVIQQTFVDQQYDLGRIKRARELFDFVRHREATGGRPLIVDAGANIGASCVYFASTFANARVVAIEPDLENFNLLTKNAEGANVEVLHGAVSSAAGLARLSDPGEGPCGYRTQIVAPEEADSDTVPRITVNQIYESHAAPYFPFIVKVDIEGAELDLFSGNTEWVARTPLLIVELHDWLLPRAGTSRSFLQCISTLDRDFVYIGENVFSIANDLGAFAAPGH
jgi:FkbM family methyltransferase